MVAMVVLAVAELQALKAAAVVEDIQEEEAVMVHQLLLAAVEEVPIMQEQLNQMVHLILIWVTLQ
jgi:hypothetical protein